MSGFTDVAEMLDPTWTPQAGYSHAAAILAVLEREGRQAGTAPRRGQSSLSLYGSASQYAVPIGRNVSTPQTEHEFSIGELVALKKVVMGFEVDTVCQVVGYRGASKLRLLPIARMPIVSLVDHVRKTELPAGSSKPPQRKWRNRRTRRAKKTTAPR